MQAARGHGYEVFKNLIAVPVGCQSAEGFLEVRQSGVKAIGWCTGKCGKPLTEQAMGSILGMLQDEAVSERPNFKNGEGIRKMNNMQIKKAIRENLRYRKVGLKQDSREERLTVDRLTMEAEKQMKTARESLPGMTRAEAWAMVRDQFLKAQ